MHKVKLYTFISTFKRGIVAIEIKDVVKRIFDAIFCFTSYASAINIVDIAVGVPAWSITADDWYKSKFKNLLIKKTIKGRINNFNKIANLISSLISKNLPFWFVIIPNLVPTIIIAKGLVARRGRSFKLFG